MTPTPEQLRAAREFLDARANKERDEMETVAAQLSTHDIARWLAAREAEAYKRGWEACRVAASHWLYVESQRLQILADKEEQMGMMTTSAGHFDEAVAIGLASWAIRALEPPSGEGE